MLPKCTPIHNQRAAGEDDTSLVNPKRADVDAVKIALGREKLEGVNAHHVGRYIIKNLLTNDCSRTRDLVE